MSSLIIGSTNILRMDLSHNWTISRQSVSWWTRSILNCLVNLDYRVSRCQRLTLAGHMVEQGAWETNHLAHHWSSTHLYLARQVLTKLAWQSTKGRPEMVGLFWLSAWRNTLVMCPVDYCWVSYMIACVWGGPLPALYNIGRKVAR